MKYYSLNRISPVVDFKQATILGQAPDKGLYFPASIPQVKTKMVKNIEQYSNAEIAMELIAPYVGDTIPADELQRIVRETVNFDIPLVQVSEQVFSLELFHGPTLAFKDIGARFMSRCLGYFAKDRKEKITVLVATSGDTGGAVANGFYNVEGVEVVILYPSGKVSAVQEKQLTVLGNNIHALEVNGTFDECQQMVKDAFADKDLNEKLVLTSANSINVARWLPQQFYYYFLWKQWKDKAHPPVIAVPSGNFGNLCAGLLAYKSGLPVKHFIAACNVNDTVPEFLRTGDYHPRKAKATVSNAMDVGDPSNFVRIMELFQQELSGLRDIVSGSTINDERTLAILSDVFREHHYLLDPHGAVAYAAAQDWLAANASDKVTILETAHPVKFFDVIEPVIHQPVPVPEIVAGQMKLEKKSTKINADTASLKSFLLQK